MAYHPEINDETLTLLKTLNHYRIQGSAKVTLKILSTLHLMLIKKIKFTQKNRKALEV